MEKSWNVKNWPKVMVFCDQSWNFTHSAPKLYYICKFLDATKQQSKKSAFSDISAKRRKFKLGREMVMENEEMVMESHGKIFCQVCGNPLHVILLEL